MKAIYYVVPVFPFCISVSRCHRIAAAEYPAGCGLFSFVCLRPHPSSCPLVATERSAKNARSSAYARLSGPVYAFFLVAAALALAAFFWLLRIMTMLRNVPTTAEPSSRRTTGMRIAQTRGRKKFCSG